MTQEAIEHIQPKKEMYMPTANMPALTEKSSAIMDMMREAAQTLDTDKLEKLMDLQERILDRDAEKAFNADFVRMKPLLPRIARRKNNTQTKSNYAPLEDINQEIDPILAAHGFGTSTKIVAQNEREVTVEASLIHRDGHKESTEITMPLDDRGAQGTVNKTLPHATASSITYAKRVAICALLNISTGDDSDGNKPGDDSPLPNDVAAALDVRINKLPDAAAYKPKFLKYMGCDDIRKITLRDLKKAVTAIEAKEQEKK
jgi:hypothetical protein